jgi:hypothetical protein
MKNVASGRVIYTHHDILMQAENILCSNQNWVFKLFIEKAPVGIGLDFFLN